MRHPLLALLIVLALPATAVAVVAAPGTAEIRQDGTTVEWVLGMDARLLTSMAGGESAENVAGFMANNTRMSVDSESCPGAMVRATPENQGGTPYARVTMRFRCTKERGQFAVINEMLLDSVVEYELGGASGTFKFDTDHTLMEVSSPAAWRRFVPALLAVLALGALAAWAARARRTALSRT